MKKMTRPALAFAIFLQHLIIYPLTAQMLIGEGTPDKSAVLEVKSSNAGFLLPRLSSAGRDSISKPATGLMIFNTSTRCVEVNSGTGATPEWRVAGCRRPAVASVNCTGAVTGGMFTETLVASNVEISLNYTGGNGGHYDGTNIYSHQVTGLTASLSEGNLAEGDGTLQFLVSGVPSGPGLAVFDLPAGNQSCRLEVLVESLDSCGAYIGPGIWKKFACYNLGSLSAPSGPFSPDWRINGDYWQWGRKARCAPGPASATVPNQLPQSGWISYPDGAAPGSWKDYEKTVLDPCPAGYRVPTVDIWEAVIANNPQTKIGTWQSSATGYSSGTTFGNKLYLPAAGLREYGSGGLVFRGAYICYLSSTLNNLNAEALTLTISLLGTSISGIYRSQGASVRCVAE